MPRVRALSASVASLHHTFGTIHRFINHADRLIDTPSRIAGYALDIVICTTGDLHLLDRLEVPAAWYAASSASIDPMMLGFECHAVMSERLGDYDFYCYLEDDLIIADPSFFDKIEWFTQAFGTASVLAPHRYEIAGVKLYVDGDIPAGWTVEAHDITRTPTLTGSVWGRDLGFRRPLNPHSGCFVLTAEQMTRWSAQPYFLDRDTRFVGPLESAANWGILRTFRLYKPEPADADFFEVEHRDTKWSEWAASECRWPGPIA